jgi:hypothetical protein
MAGFEVTTEVLRKARIGWFQANEFGDGVAEEQLPFGQIGFEFGVLNNF